MASEKVNWFAVDDVDQLDSPALVIFPERIKENIRQLKKMIDDPVRLRPHVKTHKIKEVAELMQSEGINKFKCATIAEAEMLGMCNAKDVLLAYQPVGPKINRFVGLIKKYRNTNFSCLVDNLSTAKEMADSFSSNDLTVPVFIDLNNGMNRSGIFPGEAAINLFKQCTQLKGIRPVGLHVYDGHIHDSDFDIRKMRCDAAFVAIEEMLQKLIAQGFKAIIVAGGSPTFPIHCKRKNIECSPGTFIFWDKGYLERCSEQNFVPAAVIVSRVISLPDQSRLCLDLGHKSIAAENELTRRIYFLNAPDLKATGQSEEHLVVEAGLGHLYKVGDVLYGIPIHICPTVALYERAYIIEDGKLSGEWRVIARDKKISV